MPGRSGRLEGEFGLAELFEHPVGLVAELRLALVQGLAGVAESHLGLLEFGAKLDRRLVLWDRRFEHPVVAIAVARSCAAAESAAISARAAIRPAIAAGCWRAMGPGAGLRAFEAVLPGLPTRVPAGPARVTSRSGGIRGAEDVGILTPRSRRPGRAWRRSRSIPGG